MTTVSETIRALDSQFPPDIPLQTECFRGSPLPLVVQYQGGSDVSLLSSFIKECIAELLSRHGGVLFRGFPITSLVEFEQFVRQVTPDLLDYDFGSTPRSHLSNKIYTSTEYPAHQQIPLHNEQAYTVEWPMKIWFCCATAARQGGETPIADSRQVFARIPRKVREKFTEKRLMYVRNYGNGLDVPWQKVFNTTDRSVVEAYCHRTRITCEWKADGELRTSQVCQAVAVHPHTGDSVWFNQAHLFHVSSLETHVLEALCIAVEEKDFPRNVYYGDGTSIDVDELNAIREVYREQTIQFPWEEGDVLLLDNMLAAHGRTPYSGERKVLVAMAEPYREATRRSNFDTQTRAQRF